MFEDRGNWIGIALLVLCGLSAGTMLGYIKAGEIARFSGPQWLGVTVIVVTIGLTIYMTIQVLRGRHLGDDLRGQRRRWWRRDNK